jgi:hypothetical protein
MLLEAMMGVLDKLKIVALAPKMKRSVEQDRRAKLVEQLAEQLKLVEAALGGTEYQRSKAVWVTDDLGNRTKVQRPVKLRQWWTVGANGAVQFGLRYGAVPLEVKAGMSAVEVTKLADIPLLIKALVQAVDQGELDAAIDTVTAARKTKSKRGVAA